MKYPDAARAIIIRGDKLLVMKRNKFGERYYTLPGGGIEKGETPEQTLVREVREETGLKVQNFHLVFTEQPPKPYGFQRIYLCEDPKGDIFLPDDSIEAELNKQGLNTYEPMWLALNELPKSEFLSKQLKNAILKGVKDGFPSQPMQLA